MHVGAMQHVLYGGVGDHGAEILVDSEVVELRGEGDQFGWGDFGVPSSTARWWNCAGKATSLAREIIHGI